MPPSGRADAQPPDIAVASDEPSASQGLKTPPRRQLRHAAHARRIKKSSKITPAGAVGAAAVGTTALGSLAIGALAFGALAIGALAIGRLAIGKARIRRLEIDELIIHRETRP